MKTTLVFQYEKIPDISKGEIIYQYAVYNSDVTDSLIKSFIYERLSNLTEPKTKNAIIYIIRRAFDTYCRIITEIKFDKSINLIDGNAKITGGFTCQITYSYE